jgi:hypothetical protein
MEGERRLAISKRFVVIVIVIMVSCAVLVGISYLMLDILSGMVVTPRTPVKEVMAEWELVFPLEGAKVLSMQASGDGRFLACIEDNGGEMPLMRIVALSGERDIVFSREVDGSKIAWLGYTPSLVYEDGGDIFLLEVETGAVVNLTESPEYDRDPVPSPDGRYILWTVSSPDVEDGVDDLWIMYPDASNKAFLAPRQELLTWDPAGGKIMSRRGITISEAYGSYRYFLEAAVPGREGWDYFVECEGDVRFIWWPTGGTVLYVSPEFVKGQDAVMGVWYRAERPDRLKKVASTDGLGSDTSMYLFYPAREGERLAYVGEKGLEYLDYGERMIYRYPYLKAAPPLAWNEPANELYLTGPEGVYGVSLEGG